MPVVNIQMFEGRDEAKPAIAKAVTDAIATHANVDPQYVSAISTTSPLITGPFQVSFFLKH